MLKRREFLTSLVALYVKLISRREERRNVRIRRTGPSWIRRSLFPSKQLIVNVGAEFEKLSRRKSHQFFSGLVGFGCRICVLVICLKKLEK